jgi:hypothetical protein
VSRAQEPGNAGQLRKNAKILTWGANMNGKNGVSFAEIADYSKNREKKW